MAATSDLPKAKETQKNEDKQVRVIKNPVDLQRLKLEKLMNNPTKEVIIPEKSKEKTPRAPLEFIRNIWGSSAGAGSGDFHVYRGVRRREYARQKFINEKADKEELDEAYKKKLEQNKKEAEERTAKNRAKRLKKKQKLKAKKKMKGNNGQAKQVQQESSNDDDDDDEDDDNGASAAKVVDGEDEGQGSARNDSSSNRDCSSPQGDDTD